MEKIDVPNPVQVVPSLEYAILLVVPSPTATHIVPFHATPFPMEKIDAPNPVQVIPSLE